MVNRVMCLGTLAAQLLLTSVTAGQTKPLGSINATYVAQRDCPLWIVGRKMDRRDLYAEVYLANNSSSEILRAQLGWVITDKDKPERTIVSIGTPFDLRLPAGEIGETGRQGSAFSLIEETLQNLGAVSGKLVLGVIYVRFTNGTEWTYDLTNRRAFDTVDDEEVTRRFGPKIKNFIDKKRVSSPLGQNIASTLSPIPALLSSGGAFSCLTPSAKKLSLLLVQSGGCGSPGFDPYVFVCNPGGKICSQASSPESCTDYTCPGYGCMTTCCVLNVCNGYTIC